jgi:hypothetical protein
VVASTQTYNIPPLQLWPFLVAATEAAGWKIRSQDPKIGVLTASTGMSIRSWGEKVSVRVYLQPDGLSAVTVESKARAQLYTWGKTQENLDKFFATLNKSILDGRGVSGSRSPGATR